MQENSMELEEIKRKIEVLLFASSEPINLKTFKKILSISDENIIYDAITKLIEEYNNNKGLFIEKVQNGYQIFTKPDYDYLIKQLKDEERGYTVSRAALEVLAIVAVFQPITKPEIESIRGIASDGVIKHLVDIGLLKIAGRLHTPGRPILYTVTQDFLRYFHLSDRTDLKKLYEKFSREFGIKEKENENKTNTNKDQINHREG